MERKEGDILYEWAKKRNNLFIPLDADIQHHVTAIMAKHPHLVDNRKGKSFADPFVIATAQVHRCIVVTGEKASGKPNRPKIPDVCDNISIKCISFMDLIRQERWRF